MTTTVTEAAVSSNDINDLIERLAPIVTQTAAQTVQATFITLLLQNIGPDDMSDDELSRGVHDVSTLIVLYCERLRLGHNIEELRKLTTPRVVES